MTKNVWYRSSVGTRIEDRGTVTVENGTFAFTGRKQRVSARVRSAGTRQMGFKKWVSVSYEAEGEVKDAYFLVKDLLGWAGMLGANQELAEALEAGVARTPASERAPGIAQSVTSNLERQPGTGEPIQRGTSSTAPTPKVRHPVAVPAFIVITLGIYGIYWWYQINREMVDVGRDRQVAGLGDNAFISLLAVFPGFLLLVPPWVSFYKTIMRVQRTQEVTVGSITLNGMVVLWLIIASFLVGVTAIIVPGYIQAELNKAWSAVGAGAQPERQIQPPPAATAPPPRSGSRP